ncbi:MAG: hypothetical protein ONB42_16120 [candidate division KSB1 bacterium]|nr:hypothetical protein [candidate division KSB1 bacterium]
MSTGSFIRYTRYAVAVCSVLIFACDESLPPYDPPQNPLRAELGVADGLIDRQVICTAGFKSWNLSPIPFKISIINTFDETLQGPANSVSGKLEVWKKDSPEFGKIFSILGAVDPRHVRNNILTLDPGDTLDIGFSWYHDDEQNRRIWKVFGGHFFTSIQARARIKVFKEAPELFPPELEIKIKYDIDLSTSICNQ